MVNLSHESNLLFFPLRIFPSIVGFDWPREVQNRLMSLLLGHRTKSFSILVAYAETWQGATMTGSIDGFQGLWVGVSVCRPLGTHVLTWSRDPSVQLLRPLDVIATSPNRGMCILFRLHGTSV
jgi:hypothetical protein